MNTNLELVKNNPMEIDITRDKIMQYLETFGIKGKLTEQETTQFIEISLAYHLNPFKREIYCVPYKDKDGSRKLSIITGYETYLKRAEKTTQLNGWNVTISGKASDNTAKAIITIYRKDWAQPFIHEVLISEYKQDKKIWREKPVTMLKKVAIAQGFRLAFPDEIGGIPYTADELPDEQVKEPVPPELPKPPAPDPANTDIEVPNDIAEKFKEAGMTRGFVRDVCFMFDHDWDELRRCGAEFEWNFKTMLDFQSHIKMEAEKAAAEAKS